MIDIKRKLLESYDEIQMSKHLFKDVPFYKRLDVLLLISLIISGVAITILSINFMYHSQLWLLTFSLLLLSCFLFFNYKYKKLLDKKNILVDMSIHKHWQSEDYEINKQETFYQALVKRKLLQKNQNDILLTEMYEDLCISESNFTKTSKEYLIGGGIIVAFLLPVWSEIAKTLLSSLNFQLLVSLLLLIYITVVTLYFLNNFLVAVGNNSSRKYKLIGNQLKLLRLNLLIQYSALKQSSEKESCVTFFV